MSVSPALILPTLAESPIEAAAAPLPAPQPLSGSGSSGERPGPQVPDSHPGQVQDAVKVQWEPPGEIAVYQFLNQQGTVVLQVPPQQWINLARQIAQELAQDAAIGKSTSSQGGHNGH